MRAVGRFLTLTAALCAMAASASAYYHFVHYAGRSAPFVPIPEKFDLRSLLDNRLYYFVSPAGPEKLVEGDTFAAVLSELRLAGAAWNNIDTCALRVNWGGTLAAGTPQSIPHVEVIFDEVPPGLLALGGPTARGEMVQPDGGSAFVPITRSVVILNKDMSTRPSYSTGFFLTAVHEMGHALGLQHTATSSVMSTDATRASTKASPLGADDAAALSLLYPTPGFTAQYGSITGRVTMSGAGVHLASVVALQGNTQAVSALTNPDGTYRIDGLRPGNYYVYAHALPPSAQSDLGPSEIVLPVDQDGKTFPASGPFAAEFYPGTQDPKEASAVPVRAGDTPTNVDFAVDAHAAPALYGVSTYSFPGQVAVKPAYISASQQTQPVVVAWGVGLMGNSGPAPALNVATLGGGANVAPGGVQPYAADPSFLQLSFIVTPFSGVGPHHLVFSTPNDLYLLPSAITLVERMPPSIASVGDSTDSDGNGTVTVKGSGLLAGTRILFDGEQAATLSVDASGTAMVVAPPPAPVRYRANVVALNSDGQTSLFLAPPVPYTYSSGPADAPSISLATNTQAAGAEAMIEINGANMTFISGRTEAGFGSSDIVARRVWVVSPTQLRVNVWVAPGAQPSDVPVTVTSGLQTAVLDAGFHVQAAATGAPAMGSDVANTDPAYSTVFPGSTATLPVANLPASATASSITLKLNDTKVAVTALDANKVTFMIPETFTPGPAVVRLDAAGAVVAPVFIVIDPAPPIVQKVVVGDTAVDADHPAIGGDTLTISVLHLGNAGETVARDRIRLRIGGIAHILSAAAGPAADNPKLHTFRSVLAPAVDPSEKVPVVVSLDGLDSAPFYIAVAK
ncbi:MAG TPA: IPT/TIG domain-containing protein [Bryobacteraceae bacterium]